MSYIKIKEDNSDPYNLGIYSADIRILSLESLIFSSGPQSLKGLFRK